METKKTQLNRRTKWIIGISAGVALLILATIIVINNVAEPILKERLQSEFASLSNQEAILEIAELDIGLSPFSLNIEGTSLSPGTDSTERMKDHPVLKSNIESISISNISWWNLIISGNLTINEAVVSGADLHFTPGLSERFGGSGDESDQNRTTIINSFSISGSSFSLYREDFSDVKSRIAGADLQASGLNLSSGDVGLAERFDYFSFEIDSVIHHTEEDYYIAELSNLTFSSESGDFSTEGFALIPQLTARELPRQIGHEMDHLDITSGAVDLKKFDVSAWMENRLLEAESLKIREPSVKISRDKNPPDKPKNPRSLLNAQFANLPVSISLDSLSINNGYISYREWKEGQDSSGTVFFDSVEIAMTNLQNLDHDETIQAEAKTRFMNETELSVQFDFSLYDDGAQTITGQMQEFDLQKLNPVLAPLAFVRIDHGVMKSIEFDFSLNQTQSTGTFQSEYDNFSMSLLSKDNLKESTGNRIVSFLANNIQIHSENGGANPRMGEISFEKEVGQSTVNYWWKSLRSGIKDLIQRM